VGAAAPGAQDPTAYRFEVADASGRVLLELPLAEVLETTRKGARPRPADVCAAASALLSRTQELTGSLQEQIERARSLIGETGQLLRNLRARDARREEAMANEMLGRAAGGAPLSSPRGGRPPRA
jgi:hypothetical protein